MQPAEHVFEYRLFMMFLDLDELDQVFRGRWLWSTRRRALARFERKDHLGDPRQPLDESVRDLVQEQTGRRPEGPVRLLTHLRYFGYGFNPVSFYYCYGVDGASLEAIVAEVTNTPWGERHCYVLDAEGQTGGPLRYTPNKRMHVSPFMPMDIDYDWRFNVPGASCNVHMENRQHGRKLFDATLRLERRELSGPALARVLVKYPFMTLRVIGSIHWQALKLWMKRVPVHDHPAKQASTGESKT